LNAFFLLRIEERLSGVTLFDALCLFALQHSQDFVKITIVVDVWAQKISDKVVIL